MRRHGRHVYIAFHRHDQEYDHFVYMRATKNNQDKTPLNFVIPIYVDLYIEDTSQANVLAVRALFHSGVFWFIGNFCLYLSSYFHQNIITMTS